MILDNLISKDEIEKRKQAIRDITDYKLDNLDHLPILITHFPNNKVKESEKVFT